MSIGRAAQPSRLQIETLLDFFEKNPKFAKGISKVPSERDKQRRIWEALTLRLNSIKGCKKTWQQWTKYWADKKGGVRKKSSYCAENKTVNGEVMIELTDIDQRILRLMCSTDQIIMSSGMSHDKHEEVNLDETHDILDTSTSSHEQITDDTVLPSIKRESPQFVDLDNPPLSPYSAPSSPPPSQSPPGPSGSNAQTGRQVLRRLPLSQTRPSPVTAPPNRLRQKLLPMSPPSQRLSEFNRIAERFLTLEEQRLEVERQRIEVDRQRVEAVQQRAEVDRRNSQTFATLVQRELERDSSTAQALLAIGEGLKLLAEAMKK